MKALIVLLSFISVHAFAGDRIGNGGGLWMCKVGNSFQNGMLVDLYEAQEEFDLTLIPNQNSDAISTARARLDYIMFNLPEYHMQWAPVYTEVLQKIRLVLSELTVIDDALFRIKPLASTCAGEWQYTQFANYTNQGQILIRKDIWESTQVGSRDKAALLWHEVIYRWLRDQKGDNDSVRARQIVGILFSTLNAQEAKVQLAQILASGGVNPPPIPPQFPSEDWVCFVGNSLFSTFFVGYGINQLDASAQAMQLCQSGEYGIHCRKYDMKCDQMKASRPTFSCSTGNGVSNQTYSSRGRSLVEAEGLVRKQCADANLDYANSCRIPVCQ